VDDFARAGPKSGTNQRNTPMNSSTTTQAHSATSDAGGPDGLAELRREFASLKDHVARFASQASGEVASSATGAGSDLVSEATEQAKTFAAELEGMARRNPLGTIAGAVLVGVVIGMMSRGRG